MGKTTYPLTDRLWPDEGMIEIFDGQGQRIATFACQFLRIGHVLTWDYLLFACQAVVQNSGSLHESSNTHATVSAGNPVDMTALPASGRYVYLRSDDPEAACTPSVGPRFKYLLRGPDDSDAMSGTMSHSSRSTDHQNAFRLRLSKRDSWCLVTDDEEAEAAHIIPQSRPEYYREIFGYDPVFYFDVSFGLLLTKSLHNSFDRGDWALLPDPADPSILLVHVFSQRKAAQYHGKRIDKSRFRVKDPRDLPDNRLLLFHYRQCLIKHVRGFSHFPLPSLS